MKEIFYKKVGRRYVAVSEYDDNLSNSVQYGDYLLSVYKNGSSRLRLKPAFAPTIAATRYSRDVITKAIMDASALRPISAPLTPGQKKAWEKLAKEFGDELCPLSWPAAQDVAFESAKAMQVEADKYLENPTVRNSYEQFMMVCQLTKDKNDI